ncbi:MAG TPA: hypothetical protein VFN61_15220 [Acidimicrobiales bacterium]|nr:hypothetical protein [Acidimicrobiales bacterium]
MAERVRGPLRRRRGRFASVPGSLAVVATLAAMVSGCASGQAVSDSAQQVFFQVPSGWRIYNQVQMGNNIPGLAQSKLYFFRAASANPRPSPSDVFTPSPYPWLLVEVRSLAPSEQSQMTLEGLSNVLLPNDTLASYGQGGALIGVPRPLFKGSLRGSEVSFQYPFSPGDPLDYRQVTWVDNRTDKVWAFMIGCSVTCYENDESQIGRIASNFYVEDKG